MAKSAVARDVVRTLRHQIAKIEGKLAERLEHPDSARPVGCAPADTVMRSGVPGLDAALGGGLPRAGLMELHGAATRDAGATSGFALALTRLLPPRPGAPLLWIGTSEVFREAGRPYAPGLAGRFGIAAEDLVLAEADRLSDVLWIAEEAAAIDAFVAVLIEIRGDPKRLDLNATRRLHKRALLSGRPLFLMREAGALAPTAAPLRLIVAGAPAGPRQTLAGPLSGSIGPPAFAVTISKSRTAIHAAFTLEWANDAFRERHEQAAAHPLPVVPPPAGRPGAPPAPGTVVALESARRDDAAAGLKRA